MWHAKCSNEVYRHMKIGFYHDDECLSLMPQSGKVREHSNWNVLQICKL